MRGSDLAHRVTGDVVRPHTPRFKKPGQRHLDREQRRLGVAGLVQGLGSDIERHVKPCTHLVVRIGEHGKRLVQLTPHTQTLRALPREQEADLARRVGAPGDDVRGRFAGGEGGEGVAEFFRGPGQEYGAVLEGLAGGQGVADVGGGPAVRRVEVAGEASRLCAQCGLSLAGQDPRHGCAGVRGRGQLGRCGGLFDDGVGVGAAHAEGRHSGPARAVRRGPVDGLGQQPDVTGRPVDVRCRLIGVQGAREHAVAHRHDHLDHTGDARGGLGVADVGLQRAEQERPFTLLSVGGKEGLRLDRVTERRARTVRLHRVHLGRGEPGGGEGLPDDPLLSRTVGRGQTVGRAVLVHGAPPDHREHLMAVAHGVGQALHQHHAHTLGPAGAVRVRAEGPAAAVG
ncbi:hypothetical protein GCM10010422_01620 [Streptomyces graminearus]|uniref:Uncharacterized protein n=1 Tax=Streptomyces graminearus TaxID=284030 RepID=A0ABN3KL90_9ACTN